MLSGYVTNREGIVFHRRRIDKAKDTKTVLAGQAAQKV